MTDSERQQVRQETIEQMLKVAIEACPFCKIGLPTFPHRDRGQVHFNGSSEWTCRTYPAVEALREASLQP